MTGRQLALPFEPPLKHAEVKGIPMGILKDGTPYLTARGLARVCGINHTALIRLAANWDTEQSKPRGKWVLELLQEQGYDRDGLYVGIIEGGKNTHAYADDVCMAILEYYAFEATQIDNSVAIKNYRILARHGLRNFIFTQIGYDPKNRIPDSWKYYHDRVILNDLPVGYFSVFKEIADIVIYSIQKGLEVDSHTVPDISVGRFWSQHWKHNDFDSKFGHRQKYPHAYPDYFPQAKSNPQDVFVYPVTALGEFRLWMQKQYLPQKFPKYLDTKVKQGFLPASSVELLLEAVEQKPQVKAIT